MASTDYSKEYELNNMPFSLEAEQSVLGCVLIDGSCLDVVLNYLKPECFYLPQHQSIFSAMITMFSGGMGTIDPVLLAEVLTKDGVYDTAGGRTYLLQLSQSVPSTANVESYAEIVREKYYLRTLINISKEITQMASEEQGGASQILDHAEQLIYDIRQGKETGAPKKISDIIYNDVYNKLNKLNSEDKDLYKGIKSGFSALDKMTTGLNKSDLILLGARPAMGKTSFALNVARNTSVAARKKVLFFSLEMTNAQLAERLLASEAGISSSKLRTGELDKDEWIRLGSAAALFNDIELYIDDTSSATVPEMKSKIRRLQGVDLVIIDYLGLMKSGKRTENAVQEIAEITRSLKMLAKDLQIPVITCAQLNRGTEGNGKSHKPQLADLRGSGSIEQDADIVLFLYREDYYSAEKSPEKAEEIDPNASELIVAKNRHGGTGTIKLHFEKEFTRFTVLDDNVYD